MTAPTAAPAAPAVPLLADPARRRRFSQYFTPYPVAAFMARWVLARPTPGPGPGLLADPALGPGVFARAAAELAEGAAPLRFTGFEIDASMAREAEAALAGLAPRLALDLRVGDYLASPWDERFDGILCNPPFRHFRHHPEREARLAELEARTGLRLGGQANLHSLFLLKALHQLAPGGRAAFVLPAECLDAGYAAKVKGRLLEEGVLRHVIAFPAGAGLFPGAVTTACVLLLERASSGAVAAREVAFHRAPSAEDLPELAGDAPGGGPSGGRRVRGRELDPLAKWRGHWQATSPARYPGSVPLGAYATVLRGIATGCNDFFLLDRTAREAAGLPEACLLPCVAGARDVAHPVFSPADHAALAGGGRKAWLLAAEGHEADPAVAAYLAAGAASGAAGRFLTRHRSPWYALEKRPPAPLWVSVFNRGGLKAVLNRAGARNLTAFHCLYPRPGSEELLELLFAWLLTDAARDAVRAHGREYGAGLGKVEPLDLAGTPVPDLARLPEAARRALRALVEELAQGRIAPADAAAGAARYFTIR